MEKCRNCGSQSDVSTMYEATSEECVCEQCAKDLYFCARCERVIDIEEETFTKESPGEFICENCMNRHVI